MTLHAHRPARGLHGEGGQGLAEYALILALIGALTIVALNVLGDQISSILAAISDTV